jgi:subtilisin-like proprotein convertase family protein
MRFTRTTLLASAAALILSTSAFATTIVTETSSTGGQILDSTMSGASSLILTLDVSDTNTILASGQNVTLNLFNLAHTYAGDVSVSLSHDGITEYAIYRVGSGNGGAASNYGGNYSLNNDYAANLGTTASALGNMQTIPQGNYFPTSGRTETAFSDAWNGLSVAGAWTLTVRDWSFGDTGSLGSWGLSINTADPVTSTPEPATTGLLAAGVGGLALLRRKLASR